MQVFDGFIAAIASELKINFNKKSDGKYTADIVFDNNRHQEVLIRLGKDDSGEKVVQYYSVICEIKNETIGTYKFALKANSTLDYGAVALIDNTLVIHCSTAIKKVEPETFIKSLFYIAAKADELEEKLTGKDGN